MRCWNFYIFGFWTGSAGRALCVDTRNTLFSSAKTKLEHCFSWQASGSRVDPGLRGKPNQCSTWAVQTTHRSDQMRKEEINFGVRGPGPVFRPNVSIVKKVLTMSPLGIAVVRSFICGFEAEQPPKHLPLFSPPSSLSFPPPPPRWTTLTQTRTLSCSNSPFAHYSQKVIQIKQQSKKAKIWRFWRACGKKQLM